MNGNVKRTAKAPALLTLASFIIVVAGMKAASSILVPFFLGMDSGTDWYDPLGAHDQSCQNRAGKL
jgi:hypothetical protein